MFVGHGTSVGRQQVVASGRKNPSFVKTQIPPSCTSASRRILSAQLRTLLPPTAEMGRHSESKDEGGERGEAKISGSLHHNIQFKWLILRAGALTQAFLSRC
mmetsp:Transcript_30645/g.69163  ORF Transcript_30645/g.69163 Transcript_30645/m.69163 type:complete len:102 (-) Transcript_30645:61-366(-)